MEEEQEKAFKCIKENLTEIFDIDLAKVKPESKLRQDQGLDSLDIFKLVYYIEEQFVISILDKIINEFETIHSIMDFTAKQM